MTLPLTLPQARIALGWVVVKGERLPVQIDTEWMLALAGLVTRTGGISGDTNFSEYINMFFDAPPMDLGSREALREIDELRNDQARQQDPQIHELAGVVDELRNELAASRNETQQLRQLIDEQAGSRETAQQNEQLRNRIETIEGRLA
jgi:hypothetical protein